MKDLMIPFAKGDIPARLRLPEVEGKCPGLLLMHGFTGRKEGEANMYEMLAERMVKKGYAVLQIDFVSCGASKISKKEYEINRLCEEAKCAFAYLRNLDVVDEDRCGMVGHSLGGRIACMIANDDIKCIVSLNGAVGNKYRAPWWLKEDLYRMEEECKFTGKTTFVNGAGDHLELYQEFFVALENSDTDPILDYKNDLLIVYGDEDPTVDPRVSVELYERAVNVKRDIIRIPHGNHTFQAKTLDYTIWNATMDQFIPWIEEKL